MCCTIMQQNSHSGREVLCVEGRLKQTLPDHQPRPLPPSPVRLCLQPSTSATSHITFQFHSFISNFTFTHYLCTQILLNLISLQLLKYPSQHLSVQFSHSFVYRSILYHPFIHLCLSHFPFISIPAAPFPSQTPLPPETLLARQPLRHAPLLKRLSKLVKDQ